MARSSTPVMIYHHCTQATDAQGIHIFEMCHAFSKIGWMVEKVALVKEERIADGSKSVSHLDWIQKLPIWMIECIKVLYNIPEIWRLWRAVKKHHPKFVYERNALFNFAGAIVSILAGVPLIVEINSPLVYEQKVCHRLYFEKLAKFIEIYVINHSFRTIAVTQVLKNILIEKGANSEKIVVMHNGINLEDYPTERFGTIRNFSPCKIGFVGWFREWHHLPEFISFLAEEKIFERDIELLLIGDGPARPEIEQTIARLNLQDKIKITGALNRAEVLNKLEEITIAIQPAVNLYACPMKMIEYMAAGRAIVAPDLPNIRELIHHSANGLLFQPSNWKDLSQQILRLLVDKELAQNLGRNARISILKRPYTWGHNAIETIKMLNLQEQT